MPQSSDTVQSHRDGVDGDPAETVDDSELGAGLVAREMDKPVTIMGFCDGSQK